MEDREGRGIEPLFDPTPGSVPLAFRVQPPIILTMKTTAVTTATAQHPRVGVQPDTFFKDNRCRTGREAEGATVGDA